MAITMTLDKHDFRNQFGAYNRADQFSYEGLEVLFDYLDNLSDETGENIKLDVVALCCEYQESTIQEIIEYYSIDVSDADGDEDEIREIVHNYLNESTALCGETEDGFVFAQF